MHWKRPLWQRRKRSAQALRHCANQKRAARGRVAERDIANFSESAFLDTGACPTNSEAMHEFSMSRATVNRALKEIGVVLPRGHRKR